VASVEKLVNAARDLVDGILRLASDLLDAGADAERIHRRYVTASFELADEVGARALLASAGDEGALSRLEQLVRELRELREEARAELRDQADDEREA
jgi:hypothetical protein